VRRTASNVFFFTSVLLCITGTGKRNLCS